jgi:hypothetical protein
VIENIWLREFILGMQLLRFFPAHEIVFTGACMCFKTQAARLAQENRSIFVIFVSEEESEIRKYMTHEKYMDMLRFQVSKRKIIGVEYCVDG